MTPPPGSEPDAIVVRDQITSNTNVSVVLPLSPQLPLRDVIKIEELNRTVARTEHTGVKVSVAHDAADAYLKVLLAKAATAIATTRVKQISEQLKQAELLARGGVLQTLDVLRLKSALAGARTDLIKARSAIALATGLLVLSLGLPPRSPIDVSDTLPANPKAPPVSIVGAVVAAEHNRTELKTLRLRARQAHLAARVEKSKLFPSIAAVASYQHARGGGSFAPVNAAFVGLTLKWQVWDWMGQWNKTRAARFEAHKVALTRLNVRDGIRIQVGALANDVMVAYRLLPVTAAAVKTAEEAYRLQRIRFKEGAATTTDLLGVEGELAKARIAHTTARYSYFSALVTLAKATGQLPSALLSKL
jgi:outer membrane protein TolC